MKLPEIGPVVDGAIVNMKCKDCGHKFTTIVGTGPICPTPFLINHNLRRHPRPCPKCGSLHTHRRFTILDLL